MTEKKPLITTYSEWEKHFHEVESS